LTEAEAQEQIERMVQASIDPTLSADEVTDLVNVAARPDSDGYDRTDDAWTPTWDLNAAAAEGWSRKASLAANLFNFAEDGQRFDRSQIYANCVTQRDYYAAKGHGALPDLSS
jgi:hypothetical protein